MPTRLRPKLARWLALAALLAVAVEAGRVFVGSNRHAVIPGHVYRASQPTAAGLRQQIADHNIRTVLNLRGPSLAPTAGWYADELAVCHEADIGLEDVTLSASLPPPPAELRRLVEVLDGSEHPVLIHCKQGADRTGLVSALTLLLYTDASLSVARRQLWPVYGHIALGKTAAMDRFFDQYERWLNAQAKSHDSEVFRRWLLTAYSPEVAASQLTWAELGPAALPVGQPTTFSLRAVNRSSEPWQFRPGDLAGIHLLYSVATPDGTLVVRDRAGLVRRTLPPGGVFDFTLVVPPLPAGRYALTAELLDARGAGVPVRASSFVKMGDEAAQKILIVR
jgi:protein tyrosine phosphatase (PTP) superfamily phosphohydrolase (DUF442 family)